MKVVFKKTVFEKIQEAHHDALRTNREIERIEVTDEEMYQLRRELRPLLFAPAAAFPPVGDVLVLGIRIVEVPTQCTKPTF